MTEPAPQEVVAILRSLLVTPICGCVQHGVQDGVSGYAMEWIPAAAKGWPPGLSSADFRRHMLVAEKGGGEWAISVLCGEESVEQCTTIPDETVQNGRQILAYVLGNVDVAGVAFVRRNIFPDPDDAQESIQRTRYAFAGGEYVLHSRRDELGTQIFVEDCGTGDIGHYVWRRQGGAFMAASPAQVERVPF